MASVYHEYFCAVRHNLLKCANPRQPHAWVNVVHGEPHSACVTTSKG